MRKWGLAIVPFGGRVFAEVCIVVCLLMRGFQRIVKAGGDPLSTGRIYSEAFYREVLRTRVVETSFGLPFPGRYIMHLNVLI